MKTFPQIPKSSLGYGTIKDVDPFLLNGLLYACVKEEESERHLRPIKGGVKSS
jgi:hypothetical protein